jgi:hypothetical protein
VARISGDSLLMMRFVFLSSSRGAVHLPLYPGLTLSYTCLQSRRTFLAAAGAKTEPWIRHCEGVWEG